MNVYEEFALSYYLSKYPQNENIEDIFDMMRKKESDVIIGEAFYTEEVEDVIEFIEMMIQDLERTFVPRSSDEP
jgi:hypothetical protein